VSPAFRTKLEACELSTVSASTPDPLPSASFTAVTAFAAVNAPLFSSSSDIISAYGYISANLEMEVQQKLRRCYCMICNLKKCHLQSPI
jgi:hypothetical protein